MLSWPSAVRIYLCSQPTDMRRSFDGLALLTRQVVKQDPLSGHLFVFVNKVADRVKLLYWDRDGLALWYKRLEKGTYQRPEQIAADGRIDSKTLAMMLEGVDLASVRQRPRYVLEPSSGIDP